MKCGVSGCVGNRDDSWDGFMDDRPIYKASAVIEVGLGVWLLDME